MAETPDIKELMRMAQEMQKSLKEAHDDLAKQEYVGEAGAGLVKVTLNGKQEATRFEFDPKVKLESLSFLAEICVAAVNAAHHQVEKATAKRMTDVSKKIGLPGAAKENE